MHGIKMSIATVTATLLVLFHSTHSQTVDPASTVNTATGEMQLSIPLGVVRGVGGNDCFLKAEIGTVDSDESDRPFYVSAVVP